MGAPTLVGEADDTEVLLKSRPTTPIPDGGSAADTRMSTIEAWPALNWRGVLAAFAAVLPWWVGSRIVALFGYWMSKSGWDSPAATFIGTQNETGTFHLWDVGWYIRIAEIGYAPAWTEGTPAFFPLLPTAMRWGGRLVGDPLLAGYLAANIGALIGAAALYHLVRMGITRGKPGSHQAGVYAAAFLLMSPLGLPLFVAYTEPLLLAVALPAWIAARYQVWWLAGLLASISVLARLTGLSVSFGIGVLWLITRWIPGESAANWRAWGRWLIRCLRPNVLWVLLPLGTYVAWLYKLQLITGRWDAITYVQETVWRRSFGTPWEGFAGTLERWDDPMYGYVFRREFVATFVLLAIVILLAVKRMWPEFAYAGSVCLLLTCSSILGSSLRAITMTFPFWMLVGLGAAALARRRNGPSWLGILLVLAGLGLFWFTMLTTQIAWVL
jgi:hypothetical protein